MPAGRGQGGSCAAAGESQRSQVLAACVQAACPLVPTPTRPRCWPFTQTVPSPCPALRAAKLWRRAALRALFGGGGRADVPPQLGAAVGCGLQGQRGRHGADARACLQVSKAHAAVPPLLWLAAPRCTTRGLGVAMEEPGAPRACGTRCVPEGRTCATCALASPRSLLYPGAHPCTRSLPSTLFAAKEAGWQVLGAASEPGAVPASAFTLSRPSILVMGNEGYGLRTTVRRLCDSMLQARGAGSVACVWSSVWADGGGGSGRRGLVPHSTALRSRGAWCAHRAVLAPPPRSPLPLITCRSRRVEPRAEARLTLSTSLWPPAFSCTACSRHSSPQRAAAAAPPAAPAPTQRRWRQRRRSSATS